MLFAPLERLRGREQQSLVAARNKHRPSRSSARARTRQQRLPLRMHGYNIQLLGDWLTGERGAVARVSAWREAGPSEGGTERVSVQAQALVVTVHNAGVGVAGGLGREAV